MKRAVLFVVSLYIGLPAVILPPMFLADKIDSFILFWMIMVLIFLAAAAFVYLTGIMCAAEASGGDSKNAAKMWQTMKLASVPIYVLNFLFFALFGIMMFPGTVITGFVSGFLCCSGVVLSGITGVTAIRKISAEGKIINSVHYVLQFIPVLDVVSTLLLIIKK